MMRQTITRITKHFRRWNIWRKQNRNSVFHKLLVLVGFIRSPSFQRVLLPEEKEEISRKFAETILQTVEVLTKGLKTLGESLKVVAENISIMIAAGREVTDKKTMNPRQYGIYLLNRGRKENKHVAYRSFRQIQRNLPYQRRVY